MAYLTIELKTNDQGGTAAEIAYSGIDFRMAEKKYYEILAIAATSGRPAHAAVILDSMGQMLASMGYAAEEEQEES